MFSGPELTVRECMVQVEWEVRAKASLERSDDRGLEGLVSHV